VLADALIGIKSWRSTLRQEDKNEMAVSPTKRSQSRGDQPWYFKFYKTIGLSVILDDWHPEVLSRYDTQEWVDLLASTGVDLAALQAKCHAGNAYYSTDIDHLHAGLRGRDAFNEQLEAFHRVDIRVWANISMIFDNYLFERHPDWRLRDSAGRDSKEAHFVVDDIRPGVLCINSPYRAFARKSLEAFARKYPVDYLHLDMLLIWTPICYCLSCHEQYWRDAKETLPLSTTATGYTRYVRWRDSRLISFTREMLEAFKAIRPDAVTLFNSPRPHLPAPHSPVEMVTLADAVGGDPVQDDPAPAAISYSSSTWANMKRDRPALMCIGRFHEGEGQQTGLRSVAELEVATMVAAAYNCSVMLIDAPRPDGSLYRSAYGTFKEVFDFLRKAEPFLGGERIRCAAVYVSEDTKRHLYETSPGTLPSQRRLAMEHVSGLKETFRSLQDQHIPVEVITKLNLQELSEYSLVCLPDTLLMSDAEVKAIRRYVEAGGRLLAMRYASLADEDGNSRGNFALADVFGVDYVGQTENDETYIEVDADLCRDAGIPDDMEVKVDAQALVRLRDAEDVSGSVVLPYSDRKYDAHQWVSCWSSPPGVRTGSPAVVWNTFGQGRSCYMSARLNALSPLHSAVESTALVGALARRLLEDDGPLRVDGPPWLLVTAYRQEDTSRVVLHLVNANADPQPLSDVRVSIRLHRTDNVRSVLLGFEQKSVPFSQLPDMLTFTVPSVRIYTPAVIEIARQRTRVRPS
jgi:hypothetical protein